MCYMDTTTSLLKVFMFFKHDSKTSLSMILNPFRPSKIYFSYLNLTVQKGSSDVILAPSGPY